MRAVRASTSPERSSRGAISRASQSSAMLPPGPRSCRKIVLHQLGVELRQPLPIVGDLADLPEQLDRFALRASVAALPGRVSRRSQRLEIGALCERTQIAARRWHAEAIRAARPRSRCTDRCCARSGAEPARSGALRWSGQTFGQGGDRRQRAEGTVLLVAARRDPRSARSRPATS